MARPPKPWYRAERDSWFAQVQGKQVLLARGKGSKKEADLALHRLLAEVPKTETVVPEIVSVRAVLYAFLNDAVANLKPLTIEFYQRHLKAFGLVHGDTLVSELKPHHVTDWLNNSEWGPTTRHGAATSVKRAFNWARKQGIIPANPIEHLEKPVPNQRVSIPEPETVALLRSEIQDEPFRDLLAVIYYTGCRLGEACNVTASQVDVQRSMWVLPSKTGRKTKKPRVVVLVPEALAICKRRIREHKTGPIFRNLKGTPWTRHAVAWRIKRIRDRLGLSADMTTHALRHLFATDALDKDIPIATVSELLGHSDTTMVSRVYSHLGDRKQHLKDSLSKFRGGSDQKP